MSFNITSGPTATAQKVVLYGVEGIGKSTFASQFPSPIFIDTEGSTANMNVHRMDKPTSWQMLMDEVTYIKQTHMCDTLIIDTADWAETLANQAVCARNSINSIEDLGYGKGYTMVKEDFGKLLNSLSELTDLGINVVVTAHADIKKFEKPDEMGAFDRYQLKLSKQCAPLLKEWADMVLFANYETTIVTDSKTQSKKATGGKRVMFTTHHPAWDAKNVMVCQINCHLSLVQLLIYSKRLHQLNRLWLNKFHQHKQHLWLKHLKKINLPVNLLSLILVLIQRLLNS